MEHLTIELDCTEDRCGKCTFWRNEFDNGTGDDACMIFDKILEYDGFQRIRLPACIAACKAQKALMKNSPNIV